ncbi:unnamed protein product [Lampetra fluviatilis]
MRSGVERDSAEIAAPSREPPRHANTNRESRPSTCCANRVTRVATALGCRCRCCCNPAPVLTFRDRTELSAAEQQPSEDGMGLAFQPSAHINSGGFQARHREILRAAVGQDTGRDAAAQNAERATFIAAATGADGTDKRTRDWKLPSPGLPLGVASYAADDNYGGNGSTFCVF